MGGNVFFSRKTQNKFFFIGVTQSLEYRKDLIACPRYFSQRLIYQCYSSDPHLYIVLSTHVFKCAGRVQTCPILSLGFVRTGRTMYQLLN